MLSGLRVVECSAFVAAPLAGAVLAGLGAEVIRVEQIGGGIDAKRWPIHEGESLYRKGLDRGKRSVALDLRRDEGRELLSRLVCAPGEGGGFFVSNLRLDGPLSFTSLRARRGDVVVVALQGRSDGSAAVDYTVNAGLGFAFVTGEEQGSGPVNHVLPAWDVASGLYVATALLAAERHRRITGEARLIETSLEDIALDVSSHLGYLDEAALTDVPRGRYGNAVYGTFGDSYSTADGRYVMISALTTRQWQALGQASGLTEAFSILENKHHIDLSEEGERFMWRGEINRLLAPFVKTRTLSELGRIFDAAGVLWGPFRTFEEFVAARPDALFPPASPLRSDGYDRTAMLASPRLGEHSDAVLRELLGLDDAALVDLHERGVVAGAEQRT